MDLTDLNTVIYTIYVGLTCVLFYINTTFLLNATDRWLHNIDKGHVTGVVFIDLRKAFDTGNIHILMAGLSTCGVPGIEKQQWFKSYLTGHSQSATVDGKL